MPKLKSGRFKLEVCLSVELFDRFERKRQVDGWASRSELLRHLVRQWLSGSSLGQPSTIGESQLPPRGAGESSGSQWEVSE